MRSSTFQEIGAAGPLPSRDVAGNVKILSVTRFISQRRRELWLLSFWLLRFPCSRPIVPRTLTSSSLRTPKILDRKMVWFPLSAHFVLVATSCSLFNCAVYFQVKLKACKKRRFFAFIRLWWSHVEHILTQLTLGFAIVKQSKAFIPWISLNNQRLQSSACFEAERQDTIISLTPRSSDDFLEIFAQWSMDKVLWLLSYIWNEKLIFFYLKGEKNVKRNNMGRTTDDGYGCVRKTSEWT